MIVVYFERLKEEFDSTHCKFTYYKWILQDGYSGEEIKQFEKILRDDTYRSFYGQKTWWY